MKKYLWRKQEEQKKAKSPCLAATASPITSIEAIDQIKVGSFYEIDQSKLPNRTTSEQLKSVRIVMVSEKGPQKVAVRFPSIHSLHAHITEKGYAKPLGKNIPALNEKQVMTPEMASEVLYRRIPSQEMADRSTVWSFWAVRPPARNQRRSSTLSPEASGGGDISSVVSKKGPCWSELKFTGMMKWGKRRQVKYLRRHERSPTTSSDDEETEKGKEQDEHGGGFDMGVEEDKEEMAINVMEDDDVIDEEEDDVKTEDEALPVVAWKMNLRSRKRKRKGNTNSKKKTKITKKRSKAIAKRQKQNQIVAAPDESSKKLVKVKRMVARWSSGRYKAAEENMLKVMKAKGAAIGSPILRPALRSEARKLIGDTGLLDHLLKHMAGKVAPGGAQRFRRRHNAVGAMEYWLEGAELEDIRKAAGVNDSYWIPPTGWKPGDNPTQDPTCARKIEHLEEEMARMRREMQEIVSKKRDGLAMVITPNSSLTSFEEHDRSLTRLKEVYAELLKTKANIEEQLMEVSQSLSGMKERIDMFEPSIQEAVNISMAAIEAPPPCDHTDHHQRETMQQEEDDESGGGADNAKANPATEDKEAKIQRLGSGFRICKPRGNFLWPNMGISSSQIVVPHNDPPGVPTPPSASSSSAIHRHLITKTQPPQPTDGPSTLTNPGSPPPVKPLAERRPVKTTTLGSVSIKPSASPPPPIFPQSAVSPSSKLPESASLSISKTLCLNLNELPPAAAANPNPQDTSGAICRTLTYQRRHQLHQSPNVTTTAEAAMPPSREEDEQDDVNARRESKGGSECESDQSKQQHDEQRWCSSSPSTTSKWMGEKWWLSVGTPTPSLD